MALLARHRRYWGVLFLAALLSGMASTVAGPLPDLVAGLGTLRPLLALPTKSADWTRIHNLLGDYRHRFGQTFGPIARLDALLRYGLRSPLNPRVAYGMDGWLFYRGEHALEQSLGELVRLADVERLVAMAAAMREDLTAEGGRLIVAIPPNADSINLGHLASWIGAGPAVTEYDLMLARLERAGVAAVDLRTLLRDAARTQPVYYRTETHWSSLGSLIAFNAVVSALDRPEWQWDPDRILQPELGRSSGDEARILGLSGVLEDERQAIDLGAAAVTVDPIYLDEERKPSLALETGRPGPVVAIIGDSFSRPFAELLAPHASRLIWSRHRYCRFDWALIRSFHPAIVILMPTEREMTCPAGAWPKGLAER